MSIVHDWQEYSSRCSRAGEESYPTPEESDFDLIIASITSVEGYNAAALFVDDYTGLKWLYGLKSKDEAQVRSSAMSS